MDRKTARVANASVPYNLERIGKPPTFISCAKSVPANSVETFLKNVLFITLNIQNIFLTTPTPLQS
ncbi:MAG: hypothetical protein AAF573_17505 [Bacteroidota bacterium]